jgi:hypothetical protein
MTDPDRSAPSIAVLLSVFDGDRYIAQQLESIGHQRGVAWSLLWRDDGSDPSRSAVQAFAGFRARFPDQVRRDTTAPERLGVAESFMTLLRQAPDATYYAFADQDDVWLADKLRRATSLLGEMPAGVPALYCGRPTYVDAGLRRLGVSSAPRRPLGFGNALVQNVATGCTMVLNKPAREAVLRMPPPEQTLHDWWCYLVIAGIGGHLVYDTESFILYRQHDANAIGAAASGLGRALRALRRGPRPFISWIDRHVGQLDRFRAELTPENQALLDALGEVRRLPFFNRLTAVTRAGVYRQGTAEDLVLRLWLMLRPAR